MSKMFCVSTLVLLAFSLATAAPMSKVGNKEGTTSVVDQKLVKALKKLVASGTVRANDADNVQKMLKAALRQDDDDGAIFVNLLPSDCKFATLPMSHCDDFATNVSNWK